MVFTNVLSMALIISENSFKSYLVTKRTLLPCNMDKWTLIVPGAISNTFALWDSIPKRIFPRRMSTQLRVEPPKNELITLKTLFLVVCRDSISKHRMSTCFVCSAIKVFFLIEVNIF
uniref:(northern house mosquito) hypothetical protein n=1 Tax=Culex pipiens TaxID=7175 RepID=A0A8D7ZZR0_CULPI